MHLLPKHGDDLDNFNGFPNEPLQRKSNGELEITASTSSKQMDRYLHSSCIVMICHEFIGDYYVRVIPLCTLFKPQSHRAYHHIKTYM